MCGKWAKPAKELNFNKALIDGWKCKCGEEYYNPDQAEKVLLLNKLKKQNFELKLNLVKSNLILRIPKVVSGALGLKNGDTLNLSIDGKNIKLNKP